MSELAKLTEREINGLRADLLHNAHRLRHGIPIDPKDINALCDMALKAAALERGVWVPVSKRLPPRNEHVLLCFSNGARQVGKWGGKRWIDPYSDSKYEEFTTPTHWMPLPAAPVSYDEKLDVLAGRSDE
jgi:hypothetical protein